MNIAELFVSIGITGTDKATKGLSSVASGMKGIVSTSLEAKAAVIGVVYGLERLTGSLGDKAIAWKQIANTSNIDLQVLQKWEYAAVKNSIAADKMRGSIVGVGQALAAMRIEGSAPEALGMIAQYTKSPLDINKAYADTGYFYSKVAEFAKSQNLDAATKAHFLSKLGLDTQLQSLLISMKPEDLVIPKGYNFSNPQIDAAEKMGKRLNTVLFKGGVDLQKQALILGPGAIDAFAHSLSGAEKIIDSIEKKVGLGGTLYLALSGLAVAVYAAFGPLGVALTAIGVLLAKYDENPDFIDKIKNNKDDKTFVGRFNNDVSPITSILAAMIKGPDTEAQRDLTNVAAAIRSKMQTQVKGGDTTINQGDVNITGVPGADKAKDHFTEEMNRAANIFVNKLYARPK